MPKPVLERLLDYFQNITDLLDKEKDISGIFPNNPDAGSTREDLLANFLNNHLPKRCEVTKGGFVFDSLGKESKQIDLIVTHDTTLQFRHNHKAFNYIEGILATISVKSGLDKKELFDSLENILSLPQTPDMRKYVSPIIKNPELANVLPYKIVFAFDGMNVETLKSHISNYIMENRPSLSRLPHLFIVNNKYRLIRPTVLGGLNDVLGKPIPINTYTSTTKAQNKYVGATSLILLLTELQRLSHISSNFNFDFSQYANAITKITLME